MSITNTLKHIAENSNGKMIVEKVPASKQPSAETINKIESEISAMIRENDKVAYDSMHHRKNYYSTGVKSGKIENFEDIKCINERGEINMEKEYLEGCEKLYEETHKNDPVFLSNSEGRTIASITNIDCAKDGFIEKFCLYKKESNKVAKVVKTIVFAVGLSILNPMNVSASNINQNEEEDMTVPIVTGTYITGLSIAAIGIYKFSKKIRDNNKEIYDIKLDDSNDSNMENAIPNIKIICK